MLHSSSTSMTKHRFFAHRPPRGASEGTEGRQGRRRGGNADVACLCYPSSRPALGLVSLHCCLSSGLQHRLFLSVPAQPICANLHQLTCVCPPLTCVPTCITVDLQGQARECLCCLGEVHVCLLAEEQVCVGGGRWGTCARWQLVTRGSAGRRLG
jgi:hypothetical protein